LLFTNGIDYRKWHDNLGTALYFSVSTMISTDYGDITPVLAVIPDADLHAGHYRYFYFSCGRR
jgi:hypothetical protein